MILTEAKWRQKDEQGESKPSRSNISNFLFSILFCKLFTSSKFRSKKVYWLDLTKVFTFYMSRFIKRWSGFIAFFLLLCKIFSCKKYKHTFYSLQVGISGILDKFKNSVSVFPKFMTLDYCYETKFVVLNILLQLYLLWKILLMEANLTLKTGTASALL